MRSETPCLPFTAWPRSLTIALAWSSIAVVGFGLTALRSAAEGRLPHWGPRALAEMSIVPIWALATPVILASAERRRVAGRAALRNAAHHAVTGTLFVIAANALVHLPVLVEGGEPYLRRLALAVGTFYGPAMLAYAVLIAIGHAISAQPQPALESPARSLTLRDRAKVSIVPCADIRWVQAEDNYVLVHTGARTFTARQRIGDIEKELGDAGFLRIHRSILVRKTAVKEVRAKGHGDYEVVLDCGARLPGSRSRRASLQALAG
jgi:DNA-binding LytR/AlgR family response regulator